MRIDDGRDRTVTYHNDLNGQTVRRVEKDALIGGDPQEWWYRFGGRGMGYAGNNGRTDVHYAASTAQRTAPSAGTGAFRNGSTTHSSEYDFDTSLTKLNSAYQGSAHGTYTVQGGETLQSIAANLWGDAQLWFKLAEANGLTGASALSEGQMLTVPAGVAKNTHNASTFKPYDAAEAIGDTSHEFSWKGVALAGIGAPRWVQRGRRQGFRRTFSRYGVWRWTSLLAGALLRWRVAAGTAPSCSPGQRSWRGCG